MSGSRVSQFDRFMPPLLAVLQGLGGSARAEEATELVATALSVPDEVLDEVTAGGINRFYNRVAWARFYLVKSGYMDGSKRGVWSLTDKGLSSPPLTEAESARLVKEVRTGFGSAPGLQREESSTGEVATGDETPEAAEGLAAANWRDNLLGLIRGLPPSGFERLCQRLLRESGFAHVSVTGKTNDGGIDGVGVLHVNPFVSFKVLFQCKRYTGSVSSAQVRDFRGSMQGRADKGIIMTTGTFTSEARKESIREGVPPIELVDQEKLLEMFKSLELGLRQTVAYELDAGFFEQFRN